MARTLRPIGPRVLVVRDAPTTVTTGGLHIPSTAQDDNTVRGTVVRVGGRVELIAVGERVLFAKRAGVDCELDGEKYLLLREEDVIGILD